MTGPGGRQIAGRAVVGGWDVRALARHIGCILALMWMPIVNGQPFFFPDTTSYVRAADLAVFLGSGGTISTAWTSRYEAALKPAATAAAGPVAPTAMAGNDLRAGNIMSGRSPYFGSLLYVAYVLSGFWLFVVAQAAACYGLILLAMRRVGVAKPANVVVTVAALTLGTAVAYYNGLLLADALAGFGIVAFLLLATDGGRASRIERAFLFLVVLISGMSHLTHIVMLAGMMAGLVVLRWMRIAPPSRGALTLGAGALLISVLSLYVTSFAIVRIFGKPPQLVPLMTARFIADGPGVDFVRQGCGGQHFVVCGATLRPGMSAQAFLWGLAGPDAVFLTANPADRAKMAAEDTRFARAVWQAYPVRQTLAITSNSLKQMLMFGAEGLNQGCFATPDCWVSLPDPVRGQMQASLSGRSLWPDRFITAIHYAVAFAAVLAIALRLPAVARMSPENGRVLVCWLVLFLIAMGLCDVLGGAVSEPQYRYQGRLIWILPFLGILVVLLDRRAHTRLAPQAGA